MHVRKSFTPEAIGFALRALIEHVRLFVFILLAGTGVIVLVVSLAAFLNLNLVSSFMASQPFQDYQDCVGYNCAMVAYQSGASLIPLVTSNIFSVFISFIILAVFFVGLDLGFKRVALEIHDRGESSVRSLFSCFGLAPKAFVAWVLYSMMVWVGWIFFILPGFIALLRFAFFPYFIIDKNLGPIAALKMSYDVTKNHVWDIFAFWVAIKIIGYLGFLSWIGVMLTWPLSTLAYALFYRKLVLDDREGIEDVRDGSFRAAA